MRRVLILAIALLVLSSAAYATDLVNWTGSLLPSAPTLPPGTVSVVVNAIEISEGLWDWSYLITPTNGAGDIVAFSLDIGTAAMGHMVAGSYNSSLGAANWAVSTTSSSVQWTKGVAGVELNSAGQFGFKSTWGPYTGHYGYAQDHGQYAARVPTPSIPEPMSVMLGVLGLSSVAGFTRLRRK